MRRVLGALFAAALVLGLSVPAASASGPAGPFNLTDVTIQNVGSSGYVIGHGHNNAITVGGSGNGRWSQVNCASSGNCEWKDVADGLCMDAGIQPDNGTVSEESCQASNSSELFITVNGPNGPNNPGYWFQNDYWNGVDGCGQPGGSCAFNTQWTSNTVNANIGGGSGNAAVWHVAS